MFVEETERERERRTVGFPSIKQSILPLQFFFTPNGNA